MSLVLAIDSSAHISLALKDTESGEIFEREYHERESAAEVLGVQVEELLSRASKKAESISRILIGSGPGSFTGLRIGFSFAKGLGLALGVLPEVFPSLHVAGRYIEAEGGCQPPRTRLVLADARRGEYFALLVVEDEAKVEAAPRNVEILTLAELEKVMVDHKDICIVWLDKPQQGVFSTLSCPEYVAERLAHNAIMWSGEPSEVSTDLDFAMKLGALVPTYLRSVSARTIAERASRETGFLG